jgi:hypothetical protein
MYIHGCIVIKKIEIVWWTSKKFQLHAKAINPLIIGPIRTGQNMAWGVPIC